MPWIYEQASGTLTAPGGTPAFLGYSGKGVCKNDPAAQMVKNQGPIPQGSYRTLAAITHPTLGRLAIHLEPDPANEMFGRTAFLIHGDSIRAPGSASEGCIIMAREAREAVDASSDRVLQVVARA